MITPNAATATIASTIIPAKPAAEIPPPEDATDWLLILEASAEPAVFSVVAALGGLVAGELGVLGVLGDVCSVDDSVVFDEAWFVKVDPVSELAFTVPGADSSAFESVVCCVDESFVES